MTSRGGAAITWYSYDLPKKIDYGTGGSAVSSEFFYGTGRARYKQLRRAGSSVISTIYYVGSLYERETAAGTTTHRHHIFAGGQAIGQMTRTQAGANSFEYFHRDHQGSVTKVTNGSGSVIQSLSYDAFGKRRNADWSADTAGNRFNDTHFTKQGYTGHEHLDNVRLIHMNGRVQDPTLGRFISPDPFVQSPANSQNYDRFGYTYNNPLSYTDPTGFIFKKIGRALKKVVKGIVKLGFSIVRQAMRNDLLLFVADSTGNAWVRLIAEVAINFALDRAEKKIMGSFNSKGSGGGGGGPADGGATAGNDPPANVEQRTVLDAVQGASGNISDSIARSRVEMDDWAADYGYLGFLGNRIAQELVLAPAEDIARAIADGNVGALVLATGGAVVKPLGAGVRLVPEGTTRIRHYTNRRGSRGIEEDGVIRAGDQNRVFAEPARGRPLSPRDAEERYGIGRGRGRDIVETDVPTSRIDRVRNPVTGVDELQIRGDVPLNNSTITRRP